MPLSACFVSCLFFTSGRDYVESGSPWNVAGVIVLALLSSYVKETYTATLAVFFLVQALASPQRRKTAFGLAAAIVFIGGLSLVYNAQRSPFVNTHLPATDIYFQDWSPPVDLV